jgi:hypothetical protein
MVKIYVGNLDVEKRNAIFIKRKFLSFPLLKGNV